MSIPHLLIQQRPLDGTEELENTYRKFSNIPRVVDIFIQVRYIPRREREFWISLLKNYWVEIARNAASSYIAFPHRYCDCHTHPLVSETSIVYDMLLRELANDGLGHGHYLDPELNGAPPRVVNHVSKKQQIDTFGV